MKRNFTVGEVYRPRVHIKKVKNGKVTVIRVSGEDYILRAGKKDDKNTDLKKAIWMLERELEEEE